VFDWLFSSDLPLAVRFAIAFVVVLVLFMGVAALLHRLRNPSLKGSGGRGRQARLGVLDVLAIDSRRSLVIVRRDNVEHLIMIGGPNDVVVESAIVRNAGVVREPAAPSVELGVRPEPGRGPAPAAQRQAPPPVRGAQRHEPMLSATPAQPPAPPTAQPVATPQAAPKTPAAAPPVVAAPPPAAVPPTPGPTAEPNADARARRAPAGPAPAEIAPPQPDARPAEVRPPITRPAPPRAVEPPRPRPTRDMPRPEAPRPDAPRPETARIEPAPAAPAAPAAPQPGSLLRPLRPALAPVRSEPTPGDPAATPPHADPLFNDIAARLGEALGAAPPAGASASPRPAPRPGPTAPSPASRPVPPQPAGEAPARSAFDSLEEEMASLLGRDTKRPD
jgi:flagellar protein FliO/FliZ